MSILDIIIIVAGVIIIGLYAYFQIKKTLKWKKRVRELIENGTPQEKAVLIANKEIYNKQKKNAKDKTPQEIEEEIFEE